MDLRAAAIDWARELTLGCGPADRIERLWCEIATAAAERAIEEGVTIEEAASSACITADSAVFVTSYK